MIIFEKIQQIEEKKERKTKLIEWSNDENGWSVIKYYKQQKTANFLITPQVVQNATRTH